MVKSQVSPWAQYGWGLAGRTQPALPNLFEGECSEVRARAVKRVLIELLVQGVGETAEKSKFFSFATVLLSAASFAGPRL